MKPLIFLFILFFVMNGLVLAEFSANPAESIIGQWKAEDNSIYEFSEDKVLYVNDVKYATYRFAAKTLYLKYFVSKEEFESEVQFDDIIMTLTEYKNRNNEKTLILKQVPR